MTEQPATIEDLRKKIGAEGNPVVIEFERGMIRKFAEAVGDTNPLWLDEEQAWKSIYGGIVTPPQMFCSSMLSGSETRPELPHPYKRILDGGGEWEFFRPVRLYDTITGVRRLADLYEREGRLGRMLFAVRETTWTNQRDELVTKGRVTAIFY